MKNTLFRRRGFLTVLIGAVIVAGVAGAAIPFFTRGLPPPDQANRQELLGWLISKDLSQEQASTRSTLVRRLDEEFASGVDWDAVQSQIDETQRKQLLKNLPLVLRAWISDKSGAYARLAADRRTEFLDRLLDRLAVWQGVEKLLPPAGENAAASAEQPKLAALLPQEVAGLRGEADAAGRKEIDEFWSGLQVRWFWKSLAPKT